MSDSMAEASFDEEKYAYDSFETEVPECSLNGSEADNENRQRVISNRKTLGFTRSGDFMTCESSSDEDDVILGETIAEINNETLGFIDDDDDEVDEDVDDDDDAEGAALTPAERLFKMASTTRRQHKTNTAALHSFPTPPDSKENVDDDDDDDIEYNDDYELSDCEEFEHLESEANAAEAIFRQHGNEVLADEEFNCEEEQMVFSSGGEMQDAYENVSIEDGGEVDVGEPDIGEELGEKEQKHDKSEFLDEYPSDDETEAARSEQASISSHTETDEEAGAAAAKPLAASNTKPLEVNNPDDQGLSANDSMESFKRRVLLSDRMRCQSERGAGGDCVLIRGAGRMKSSIPIWTGHFRNNGRFVAGRDMPHRLNVSSRASLPEFTEKSETESSEKNIDVAAGGDYNSTTNFSDVCTDMDSCGGSSNYEKELERFLKVDKPQKPPKKLKPGERRNKSFSNERLRDIERSNHILLRKIINQKPTVSFTDKKKKLDKFGSLPPTTRTSSAEINRKKQERQIALDNQLFKRKLDAILQRKPKIKSN